MTNKPGVSSLESTSTRLNDDAKSKTPNMPKIRSRKIADSESVDRVKCDLVLSARRRRIWKPSAFQRKGQCVGMTTAGKNLGNRPKQGWVDQLCQGIGERTVERRVAVRAGMAM